MGGHVRDVHFDSLYGQGFARIAVGVPPVRVADPSFNVAATLELADRATERGAVLAVFPELGLTGYSAEDLFHQSVLVDAVEDALARLVDASTALSCALVVGAPVVTEGRLFNCAVVINDGAIVGVVPKSYLPSYREFYEKRQFCAARDARQAEITVCGARVPFGTDLLFAATHVDEFTFHVEICEDLWVPAPPSSYAAMAGATVLLNLSASNALVAKADYRRLLCASQSARCLAAYVYTAAGAGESTTDLAWDGHALVYENGDRLAEAERFVREPQLVVADVDCARLAADRLRMTSFTDAASDHAGTLRSWRRVPIALRPPDSAVVLERAVARFPFVPADPAKRDERCAEVYHIQVQGLVSRLAASGIDKVVVGVSGGLDSTQALVVAAKAMDSLGLERTNVLGVTMPGFATTARTRANAHKLMDALGVTKVEIDIRPAAQHMLTDIGHAAAEGNSVYDVTYENVQAGERTSHLFRLANLHGALVVGTGDLSELAVGWCTYGVGDQMSHYGVNASVPKTLVRYLIAWIAGTGELANGAEEALRSVLATKVSPELVPSPEDADGQPGQGSEDVVGPFELVDFFLYYILRYGYRPSRVAYLAHRAWADATAGAWPEVVADEDRHAYDLATIKGWLRVFLRRFVETSQFKRSAMPNGPKVGSGGSLSPRGDWRAPSDAVARAWIEELDRNIP
ncbi:MAG: NAD(+) synthase [Actinomycetota bacterium]|nr:NAD(+) synthase [Actinomycetota bacterium]